MPVYRIDAVQLPRPITLKAKSLSQAAAYADEAAWRTRSIQFLSEQGEAAQTAEIVLRDDYRPKSLATKIELTIGQITLGILLTVGFFIGVGILLAMASFMFGW